MTTQRALDEPEGAGPGGPGARQPMFNLPAVIVWVLAIMWLVQLVRDFLLSRLQNLQVVIEGGFIPVRYSIDLGEQSLAWLWTPLTYSLLHGGFAHIIVNSIWLMAFGAVVARRIGTGRFLVFWLFSAVASAGLYWLMNQGSNVPMIGASGVVSGLMGAAARFAFPSGGRFNRTDAHLLPRLTLAQAMGNKTVLIYVAVWFGINALAAFGFAAGAGDGAQIAWEAHIGGFIFGFLLFPLFDVQPRH
ncbi:rhomboid family intramembrane serine protease [Hoeflea prorocentri]|uniref:Rhomboid family intramembrane serine protease n=1 Tax=Hoeflea prorocentri TaxID=1922333 RepID=A0A9X3ZGM5_9HYPH|nr:rhomboid family intramembrane serine protease [Hoeflea prorocentri]MCY6380399.1 rhomboid family intramembrane serine protease [Hoeflea prorocentri]MDA5398199.1 rhomboid family intramembrane serine protease [Hoeflea prorocentri]